MGALVLGAAAVASSAGGPAELSAASQHLPDLDQEAPWNLEVTRSEARGGYRLGFSSAVRNVGAGPLIVSGRRRAATPTMRVDQLVEQEDAPIGGGRGGGPDCATCAPPTMSIGICSGSSATSCAERLGGHGWSATGRPGSVSAIDTG